MDKHLIVTSVVRGEFAGTSAMLTEQFQRLHPDLWPTVKARLGDQSVAEVTLYWTDTKGFHLNA